MIRCHRAAYGAPSRNERCDIHFHSFAVRIRTWILVHVYPRKSVSSDGMNRLQMRLPQSARASGLPYSQNRVYYTFVRVDNGSTALLCRVKSATWLNGVKEYSSEF